MEIFSYCHFHNASKECFWSKKNSNFMHGFKSAILAIFHFCQNGTFEPVIIFVLGSYEFLEHLEG